MTNMFCQLDIYTPFISQEALREILPISVPFFFFFASFSNLTNLPFILSIDLDTCYIVLYV